MPHRSSPPTASAGPLRLAILECDTPVGATKEKYGTYGNLFSELLHNGLSHLPEAKRPRLEISAFDVVNDVHSYPDEGEVDAVLITGSKFNAFDDDEWILRLVEFTRRCLKAEEEEEKEEKRRVRVVGVCFGHQIVGRALGCKVDRGDSGWEVSVVGVRLTERGRGVFFDEGGIKEEGEGVLYLHQMHRDIVYEWPEGVEHLGSTDRCEVQGMYAKKRLITVQGHPEFNGSIVAELLERRKGAGVFDDGVYEDGMRRVRKTHDGVVVAAAFLRFMLEE